MGRGAGPLSRRAWLAVAAGAPLAGCAPPAASMPPARWVGANALRGHRLRSVAPDTPPALTRRTDVLILGGGIAGLAAARALRQQGVDDLALLELEDQAGGNSRGHAMATGRCPLGAHYLPLPGPHAHEVSDWLHELGLLRHVLGRTVAEERHLCHTPQERLFIDGAWHDGLLPPAEPRSATLAQYRRFAQRVAQAQREIGFALPTRRAGWTAAHAALDAQTFAQWLAGEGFTDARLLGHLDYACRDDYGAGLARVSAWAGLHYFASRHGFQAPGDESAEREAVFTWPEGNAWLAERLAAPLGERVHGARMVWRLREERHGVQALVWNDAAQALERWDARAAVVALPLHVAARVLAAPPPALAAVGRALPHAPWLVANLQLTRPLLDRGIGAPLSWDNVRFQTVAEANGALGYVNADHQNLSPVTPAPRLTAYWALREDERAALLNAPSDDWARRVIAELALVHPDLPERVAQVDLMRHGHAMAIPAPGVRGSAALAALAEARGRVVFAHADLAGYSVFEEAFTAGALAARRWRR